MAKSRRRARRPPPQARAEPRQHRRQAAIWLATLSTVVGIATGMFTLRDQVFPRESGSAQAVSTPAYQQQVGRVCDELNTDDGRRAREAKTVRKRLRLAETTLAQRNALLDGQRRTIARSGHALAAFTALETPKPRRPTSRDTTAAWNRNLGRLRGYAQRLDEVTTRPQLEAALRHLLKLRTPLAKDGVKLMAGLRRLGGANCDLRIPISTPTFPLPPLHTDKPARSAGSGNADDEASGATAQAGAGGPAAGASADTGGSTFGAGTGSAGTTGPGTSPGGTTGGGAVPGGGSTGTGGSTGGGIVPGRGGTGTGGSTGGSETGGDD